MLIGPPRNSPKCPPLSKFLRITSMKELSVPTGGAQGEGPLTLVEKGSKRPRGEHRRYDTYSLQWIEGTVDSDRWVGNAFWSGYLTPLSGFHEPWSFRTLTICPVW
jgi:hypothetical protein